MKNCPLHNQWFFELYLQPQFYFRMRTLILTIAGILFIHVLAAQVTFPAVSQQYPNDFWDSDADAQEILRRIDVNQDPRLEKMLKWHVENNKKRDGMDGYRVEIFFSSALNAKDQSLRIKKDFMSKYPEHDVHVKFTAPNFRVRVGDFRTKNEALKLHKQIQKDYPGAFIVPDVIDFPLLKSDKYERPD